MNEPELRACICEVGRQLCAKNFVAATDGNISVRLADDRFLCTPSGVSKGRMRPSDILIADGAGRKLDGPGKVTSEFFTHLAAYEERPDILSVVHAHPPTALALTLAGISMEAPVIPEVVVAFGAVPTAPYATPGTKEGAEAIREYIRQCDVVLLYRHGAVTVGQDPWDACSRMEKLEHAAEILYKVYLLGKEPPHLTRPQIDRLIACRTSYGPGGKTFRIPGVER